MTTLTLLTAALLMVAVSVAQRHNLIDCRSQAGDRLLAQESSARSFKFLSYVSDEIIIDVGRENRINCVEIIDRWNDGTGGFAQIIEGGVTHTYVKVKIRSKFNRSFWFDVKVYGQ
ncbi:hypothetical protein L798_08955 [Zootermopsis nevadensis]|uniref:Salivary secreted peptide n=1 Tax=Zootermopsis nevadensis TaxID=136037 RepID=A0A067REB5_ZOONE|nr:hypothetical protein L798_08955 [Zootermopsis nevadensis]